jgi:uncharacterized protein
MTVRFVDLAAANAAVLLGAILQASTGLGAGLIIVPLLALISLDFIPGPIVLASVALSGIMAVQGRREIQANGLGVLALCVCVGVIAGALSISAIPLQRAGIAFGTLVLLAVAISVAMPDLRRNAPMVVAGGAFAGFMAAISGIGAPLVALLYQHEPPRVLRATLGLLFTISSLAILVCLHFVGRFGAHEAWLGLLLAPGYVIGFFVAIPAARLLDRGNTRKAVLVISTLSALLLIARSV